MMNNKSNIFKKIVIIGAILVVAAGFAMERLKQKDFADDNPDGNQKNSVATMQSLVGKAAPVFTLTDRQGKIHTNESLKGKNVVLFFNEGLACYPACWDQMKQLSSDRRLNTDDTVTLSVVMDSTENWKTAATNMSDLGAVNVAFDSGEASRAFGTTNAPSSMHGGVPGHSYVIIDKDGIVRYVLDDPKMGINNEKLYEEIAKLN